jgi:hypothetical protein
MEEIIAPESLPQSVEKNRFLDGKRRIVLIYIPLVATATIIVGMFLGARSRYVLLLDIASGIGMNILALAWCKIDAKNRNYQLSKHFPLFVVLLGIFTLIYYLLRSRGIGRGLISIGWLVVYIVTVFVALTVAVLIVVIPLVLAGVLPKTVFD